MHRSTNHTYIQIDQFIYLLLLKFSNFIEIKIEEIFRSSIVFIKIFVHVSGF